MTGRSEMTLVIIELAEKISTLGCSRRYLESTLELLRLFADFFASAGFAGLAASGTLKEDLKFVNIF